MGSAYTFAEIIRCQHHLGQTGDLNQLAVAALAMAKASNTPQVEHYVIRALYEVCDESEEKLRAFMEGLSQPEKGGKPEI